MQKTPVPNPYESPLATAAVPTGQDVTKISQLSGDQWRSGIAAWLGWLFDGLDMHLYTLVATPFVAALLLVDEKDSQVGWYSSLIQAAFLVGWALGGGFFGRIADRMGRSRALMLTILTYAMFTGLSFLATTWWHLFIFRFLAALGIGGEWAVGASLLSETWPRRWRPWMAAILQTGVNIGILLACAAGWIILDYYNMPKNYVFLVGVLPAFLVLWIRRAVPEPEEWHEAQLQSKGVVPGVGDLFRGSVRKITLLTILVCSLTLSGHWAFMFWFQKQLRGLPELANAEALQQQVVIQALTLLMAMSIIGNFVAAALARFMGYRNAIVLLCVAYFFSMMGTYGVARDLNSMWHWLPLMGITQGVFALFTMYMPPLFPTLLRTTGAGFCYNIGRIAAAVGTVVFGLFAQVGDYRYALLVAGCVFLPAAIAALFLPEPPDERSEVAAFE